MDLPSPFASIPVRYKLVEVVNETLQVPNEVVYPKRRKVVGLRWDEE